MATFASALAELSAVAGRTLEPEAANALVRALATLYEETRDQVTKAEFHELKELLEQLARGQELLTTEVRGLAEAQRRTEERVSELVEAQQRTEERLNELAEAQRRTEERVNELAEAQRRTEERVNELAEAQRRTEERVSELVEAQQRTEERLNEFAEGQRQLRQELHELAESHKRLAQSHHELAESHRQLAQSHHELAESHRQLARSHAELAESHRQLVEEHRQTQQELRQLTKQVQELVPDHRRTRELLGALPDTVGYGLEDRAIRYLPRLLKKQFNLVVQGSLERKWVEYPDGRADELNIFGEAVRDGRTVTVIGEAKARPGATHLRKLEKRLQRLEKHGIVGTHRFVFIVAYSVDPRVARLAEKKNIAIIPPYRLGVPG